MSAGSIQVIILRLVVAGLDVDGPVVVVSAVVDVLELCEDLTGETESWCWYSYHLPSVPEYQYQNSNLATDWWKMKSYKLINLWPDLSPPTGEMMAAV